MREDCYQRDGSERNENLVGAFHPSNPQKANVGPCIGLRR